MYAANAKLYNTLSGKYFNTMVHELGLNILGELAKKISQQNMFSFSGIPNKEREYYKRVYEEAKERIPVQDEFKTRYIGNMFDVEWDSIVSNVDESSARQHHDFILETARGMNEDATFIDRALCLSAHCVVEDIDFRKKNFSFKFFSSAKEEADYIQNELFSERKLSYDQQNIYDLLGNSIIESAEADEVIRNTVDSVKKDIDASAEKSDIIQNVARQSDAIRKKVEQEFNEKLGVEDDTSSGIPEVESPPSYSETPKSSEEEPLSSTSGEQPAPSTDTDKENKEEPEAKPETSSSLPPPSSPPPEEDKEDKQSNPA